MFWINLLQLDIFPANDQNLPRTKILVRTGWSANRFDGSSRGHLRCTVTLGFSLSSSFLHHGRYYQIVKRFCFFHVFAVVTVFHSFPLLCRASRMLRLTFFRRHTRQVKFFEVSENQYLNIYTFSRVIHQFWLLTSQFIKKKFHWKRSVGFSFDNLANNFSLKLKKKLKTSQKNFFEL